MSLTRDHLERIIIDRILIDSPEGRRSMPQESTLAAARDTILNHTATITQTAIHTQKAAHTQTAVQKANQTATLLSDLANFKTMRSDSLKLDERLPHALLKPIASRVKTVAERYTTSREITIPPLLENECQAYASYYLLINIEKTSRLLESFAHCLPSENLRVLDYGCGPGAGALALATIRQSPFDLVAIDSNPHMRKIASKLFQDLKSAHALRSAEVLSPESPIKDTFDLIILSHVLNEMRESDQDVLLKKIAGLLSPQGTILILESALPKQTRELMRLRDLLLSFDSSLEILFPCTHRNSCPMLKHSENDWCHGSMNWNPPHLIRQIDQLTGFNKHELKYSGMILTRNQSHEGPTLRSYRVVAPPEHNKTGHSVTLCGDDFYGVTTLRKRSRHETNIEFRRAEHFDLLDLEGTDVLVKEFPASFKVDRKRAP